MILQLKIDDFAASDTFLFNSHGWHFKSKLSVSGTRGWMIPWRKMENVFLTCFIDDSMKKEERDTV